MIFGLFENKKGRAFREETANTLADADSLEKKDKKRLDLYSPSDVNYSVNKKQSKGK